MRGKRTDRGQAFTETILLTWILIAFVAAVYQLFIVNDSIYRSTATVHEMLFRQGFESNCYEKKDECEYNTDEHAKVIWNARKIPEIKVQTVGLFARFGLSGDVVLKSNVPGRPPEPQKGCPVPCKKSKMAAGTYMDPTKTLDWARN